MTSDSTSLILASLACGVVACASFVVAQSRQTAVQSASQHPPVQSNAAPRLELAKPSERSREATQTLITPEEYERREGGLPLRMPAEQIEAANDRQLPPGD